MRLRFLSSTLLLCGLAGGAWAAEPAAEFRIADGKDLIAHWNQGPLGQALQDPAMAPLRAKIAEGAALGAKTLGADPWTILAATSHIGGRCQAGGPGGLPSWYTTLDAGPYAAGLFSALAGNLPAAKVDGADGALTISPQATLARFASLLVAAGPGKPTLNGAVVGKLEGPDFLLRADLDQGIALARLMLADHPDFTPQIDQMAHQWAAQQIHHVSYRARFTPEGVVERFSSDGDGAKAGVKPVDLALLGRLPGATLMAGGFGIDGERYWQTNRQPLLESFGNAMHQGHPATGKYKSADELEADLNATMKVLGMTTTIAEVVKGFTGTSAIAITNGVPAPGITLIIPSAPGTDALVAWALGKVPAPNPVALPAVGTSTILPIPNLPLAITLGRDAKHWVLTSDPLFASGFLTGKPNGWLDSEPAKIALEKGGKNCYFLGASDTPAVLRTLGGYAAMFAGMMKGTDPAMQGVLIQAFPILASKAKPGYAFATTIPGDKEPLVMEWRSLTGLITIPVAAGIVLPAMNMARNGRAGVDKEALAVVYLKSGLFPAEIQFQAAGYLDADGDGHGEYGTLPQISGRVALNDHIKAGSIKLVSGALAKGDEAEGYRFQVFLPDTVDAQEQYFVIYALPIDPTQGRTLAITESGLVYASPEPIDPGQLTAGALFSGKPWESKPSWPAYVKGETQSKPGKAKPAKSKPDPTKPADGKPAQGNQF